MIVNQRHLEISFIFHIFKLSNHRCGMVYRWCLVLCQFLRRQARSMRIDCK